MHRNIDKPYRIDKIFLPEKNINESCKKVGAVADLLTLNEYVPLISDLPLNKLES